MDVFPKGHHTDVAQTDKPEETDIRIEDTPEVHKLVLPFDEVLPMLKFLKHT